MSVWFMIVHWPQHRTDMEKTIYTYFWICEWKLELISQFINWDFHITTYLEALKWLFGLSKLVIARIKAFVRRKVGNTISIQVIAAAATIIIIILSSSSSEKHTEFYVINLEACCLCIRLIYLFVCLFYSLSSLSTSISI